MNTNIPSKMSASIITKSHLENQLDAFYEDIFNSLKSFINDNPVKYNNEPYRNFLEYWLYNLYSKHGIKRKIIKYGESTEEELNTELKRKIYGDNSKLLVQLFYNKSKNYDKTNLITQLCRHLIFDFNSFSIVSLGTSKSLDFDAMVEVLPKNPSGEIAIIVEKFYEPTMIIYNPVLKQFNYEIIHKNVDEESEECEKQIRNLQISSRCKMGTSYFHNPNVTFGDMFNENNTEAGLDLSKIDNEFISNFCFVFNVEHKENRIINSEIVNRNVLVNAFQVKQPVFNYQILTKLFEGNEEALLTREKFMELRENIITETNPLLIKDMFKKMYNMDINTPQIYEQITGSVETVKEKLADYISKLSRYDAGIMIKDLFSGTRSKISNNEYKKLLELKGHYPMTLKESNNNNLFRIWWKLRTERSINNFLKEFDNENKDFETLFNNYNKKVYNIVRTLFNEYQDVFVKKLRHASTIEYKFKPMCGDLHKAYMAEKRGRTIKDVSIYISTRKWYQIYWRLFGLTKEIENTLGNTNDVLDNGHIHLPDY